MTIYDVIQAAAKNHNVISVTKRNTGYNIFNKEIIDPKEIFNKILNDEQVNGYEVEYLNTVNPSVVNVHNKSNLWKIVRFYSDNYPEYSMNWLDVSEIDNMYHLFYNTKYNGDISKWDVSNVKYYKHMFMRGNIKDEYIPIKFINKTYA